MKRYLSAWLAGILGCVLSTPAASQTATAARETGPVAAPSQPAAVTPPNPAGALFRSVFGDGLEKHKIALIGWAEASLIASGNDSRDVSPAAFFNTDRGANLNQVAAMLCSGRACPPLVFGPAPGLHNRVGPFPGPKQAEVSVDFNITTIYGSDARFLKLSGLDGDIRFDRNSERKFSIPQAYLDVSLPILDGTSVLIGSFQTSLENEIGYSFSPPNSFATHTYAFEHGPAKHVGILAQSRLPTSPSFGLLSVDYGVVLGWNDWDNRNGDLAFMGAVRWRSPDMRTWIDVEAIYGNGENDFGAGTGRGGSAYFALSSTGAYLGRFSGYATVLHTISPELSLALEATYGRQEGGDVKFVPFAITEDAQWYGVNVGARYKVARNVFLNGRGEWFKDEKGANVLWNGVRGDVYAATGNVELQLTPAIRLRAEARYDVHDGPGALYDNYTRPDQVIGLINVFALF